MKNVERVLGFIAIILILVLGKSQLISDILFFRLIIGLGLGYTLSRSYTGFAGSVNRAYMTGSTKLMRTLMFMFFISGVATAALLFKGDATSYGLWINPINLGLILGGLLFGFGMSFSSCCASGVLTDLITALPRAFFTLIFFGMGVFLGFPLQNTASIVTESWFTSSTGESFSNGVFLPDLFQWDGLGGYLGAIVLTGIFALIVIGLSYEFERKRKNGNTYTEVSVEKMQEEKIPFDSKDYVLLSEPTYKRMFVNPWTLIQGAVVIALLFILLMGVTRSGWGASTPYGLWFGKILMIFGVSAESLASFTKMKPDGFLQPFFENGVSVQNFGILLGTIVYLLTASKFVQTFTSELKISFKEASLFAMGGLAMGLGTRLANGCNVGALYTPIANFSLSGWIFLVVMIIGGWTGNVLGKRIKS
ncbi:YeeE/YedE family protein [Carnobacterium sp. ISL-102]|uniref:YeeE/YedE family protein n=1 Tax=Carnobacterium sp. ISL-102 TaxID=2819142 RepID=UPI001BE908EE|nr:YeeE/YedE family protein [Carnobacterium sp. ISL-102]MBT2732418.1 YeeE/YedE family protein [Carnobacterium sp. ISL-102]